MGERLEKYLQKASGSNGKEQEWEGGKHGGHGHNTEIFVVRIINRILVFALKSRFRWREGWLWARDDAVEAHFDVRGAVGFSDFYSSGDWEVVTVVEG